MKPLLLPTALYFCDNGRITCGACAGTSAKYTGRDISGQWVERVSAACAADWYVEIGDVPRCETCKRAHHWSPGLTVKGSSR